MTLYTFSYVIFLATLITALYMLFSITLPLPSIFISMLNASLSTPAFKLHIPLDNFLGSIGITVPGI
ncbi:hypothetical protein D3C76_888540 [compost metagenome]